LAIMQLTESTAPIADAGWSLAMMQVS
jgi:hypothetical protein